MEKQVSMKTGLTIFALFLLLNGCAAPLPEIAELFHQLHVVQSSDGSDRHQQLSLFIRLDVEEGAPDIHSVYLIHDNSELYWVYSPEELIEREIDGMPWMGTNGIAMPDNTPFPAGRYRVAVVDAAGEEDEQEFYLSRLNMPEKNEWLPLISISHQVEFESPFSENYLRFYTEELKHLHTEWITPGIHPLPALSGFDKQKVFLFYIFSYEHSSGAAVVTGPFYLSG